MVAKGPVYGSTRTSSSLGSSQTKGNAIAIPRSLTRDSTSKDPRPSLDRSRDGGGEHEGRSFGRFHSPSRYSGHSPSRFPSDSFSSSHGMETISPFSLKRPVDRRKESQKKPAEPLVVYRKEGFETKKENFQPAHPISLSSSTSSGLSCSPPQTPHLRNPSSRPDQNSSEKKPEGLLSRTLSSRASNPEALRIVQEKLEHCLGSRPSIGQDIDGESISHLRRLAEQHEIFDSPSVRVAYNIASVSYNNSERGRRVMRQCVDSACILADLGADETIVSSALLKDILTKSMMTEEHLKATVSKPVSDLVSKVGRLEDVCQIRQQMVEAAQGAELDSKSSEDINRLLMTLADYKGVLVKLADRVAELQHSVRTNAPYCERSAREALEVFAPMANRLGVWSLKAMLEDLAFKVLHPAEHSELHSKLRESQDRGTIESALDELSSVLGSQNIEGVDLSGRPKNLYGVMRKMHDKNKNVDQVYDVRALRVIVQSKNDCYAVLREVYRLWPEVKGCFKDYIRKPKPNGYRSLHTVVRLPDGQPMEIQIRTDKMHFIAEYGVAAHWRYKEKDSKTTSQAEEQQVNWARWLISWSLELRDFKCRPKGSPSNDSTFTKLANSICSFPKHGLDCEFAAWASKSLPRPVSEAEMAERPAMVVCMDHTSGESLPITSIKELPAQSTVKDLASMLEIPLGSHVLVNTLEATDDSQILASGDRIEIFSKPKEQKLSKKELELQREKLKRLFGHSPSGYGSSPSGYGYSPKTKIEPSRMGSASLV